MADHTDARGGAAVAPKPAPTSEELMGDYRLAKQWDEDNQKTNQPASEAEPPAAAVEPEPPDEPAVDDAPDLEGGDELEERGDAPTEGDEPIPEEGDEFEPVDDDTSTEGEAESPDEARGPATGARYDADRQTFVYPRADGNLREVTLDQLRSQEQIVDWYAKLDQQALKHAREDRPQDAIREFAKLLGQPDPFASSPPMAGEAPAEEMTFESALSQVIAEDGYTAETADEIADEDLEGYRDRAYARMQRHNAVIEQRKAQSAEAEKAERERLQNLVEEGRRIVVSSGDWSRLGINPKDQQIAPMIEALATTVASVAARGGDPQAALKSEIPKWAAMFNNSKIKAAVDRRERKPALGGPGAGNPIRSKAATMPTGEVDENTVDDLVTWIRTGGGRRQAPTR